MRSIDNPRLLAFEVLIEVELNGAYSNLLLPKYLTLSGMSTVDKAFTSELVYGTLRMKGLHDQHIKRASDRTFSEIDPKVLMTLRIGVHQLTQMRVPDHAAINETVELAKRVNGKAAGSFVNAVLRRVSQGKELRFDSTADVVGDLAKQFSHPEWIVSSYLDSLKEREAVEQLLSSNNKAAKPTLIAWPGRSTLDELIESGAKPISNSSVAAEFEGDPGSIAAIRERRAGVQDIGSQMMVELFFETYDENLRWLDMCAGPGGKAAYLSALLAQRSGELVANEISHERSQLVKQVLSLGSVTNFDGRSLPDEMGNFDRILLDAPCTGIGALRRRPEVRWRRSLQDLKNLTVLQEELLNSAASRLNAGGYLAYVTCSPHQAETTFQVRSFLHKNPDFEQIKIAHPQALPSGAIQLWTHIDNSDAMFMALLRKKG